MKLSVIIPALNEAQRIGEAVQHAFALNPFEVIVADGGSIDATAAIARDAGAQALVVPRGRARQQNAAARVASGDVLFFQHADCWLESQAADQIVNWFDHTDLPVASFLQRIDSDGLIYRLLEIGNAFRICALRLPFGDQGIVFRKTEFDRLGGFPDVPLMEDVILMRRVRSESRIALLAGPLHVDARRWQKHGPIRQTIRNFFLLTAEKCGVPPEQLANLYLPHWLSKKRRP